MAWATRRPATRSGLADQADPEPFSSGAQPAARRDNPPDPGPDPPGVRQRRRDRQPGIDRAGRVGDRTHGGFRAGRPDPVRRIPPIRPRTRLAVRAAGGEKAGPGCRRAVLGGYVASGAGTPDRLPRPHLPAGLSLTGVEGAGEVQTPVRGTAAGHLQPGNRVWLRHAKAGELAERFKVAYRVIHDDGQVTTVPTYRGEGQCFG